MHKSFLRAALSFSVAAALVVPAVGCAKKTTYTQGGTKADPTGGTAQSNKDKATMQGPSYNDLTCDGSQQGVGECVSDTGLVYCDSGNWLLLDCSQVPGYVYCGETDTTVDCYPAQ